MANLTNYNVKLPKSNNTTFLNKIQEVVRKIKDIGHICTFFALNFN